MLTGNKAGDNSQVLALAEGLGWPFEIKRFVYKAHEIVPNMLLRSTVAGIDTEQSSPLQAPWPELVITAGRRNEPIARWIKQQAPETVHIVHVGRPWSRLHHFDLVVTTPQYRLPTRPNVLHNKTPLHRVTKERLAREAARWRDRLAHLPGPLVAVTPRCPEKAAPSAMFTAAISSSAWIVRTPNRWWRDSECRSSEAGVIG